MAIALSTPNHPMPIESAGQLVAAFLSGRSPRTISGYSQDLEVFRAFLGLESSAAAAALILSDTNGKANAIALAWRSEMIGSGLAPATVNRRLSALRALVALARTLGLVTWRIDIRNVRATAYRNTAGPRRDGVARLVAVAAAQADRPKAARDVALIRLLHDTALRRGEVVALDLADVDLADHRVMVLGKGRLEKVPVTLPEPTGIALADWIAARGVASGPLFVPLDLSSLNDKNRRLTGTGLWHIIKSLGRVAGLDVRPHGLRHSAITSALDATGGNIRAVQKFSRHVDVRTLEVYDDNREDLGGKVAAIVAL